MTPREKVVQVWHNRLRQKWKASAKAYKKEKEQKEKLKKN